jgi:hypothetical protein
MVIKTAEKHGVKVKKTNSIKKERKRFSIPC